jgi:hypothetical protein
MHRIAAAPLLALMLIAGQDARAAETTRIITLSCEGTVRSGPGPGDVQRINSFLGTRDGATRTSQAPHPPRCIAANIAKLPFSRRKARAKLLEL